MGIQVALQAAKWLANNAMWDIMRLTKYGGRHHNQGGVGKIGGGIGD
jgi:hypothetical protein